MRFRQLLWCAPLLVAACATPRIAPAPMAIDPARLATHIKTLSSDAFEGRGTATSGEQKAVDYIVSQFQAAGLAPGGDPLPGGGRDWVQKVELRRYTMTGTPSVTLDLAGKTVALRQAEDIALRAPSNGQASVRLSDVPLLFVGYGVDAPERGWSDFKDVDVAGKMLVVLVNDPDFEGPAGADFGGKAMTYYGRWTYKYAEAAERGAAGVMIVHETAPASYGWQTVANSNNSVFDVVRDDPAAAHAPFESWIQRDLAVRLFRDSGLDFETAKRSARSKDFRPVPLKATLDAAIDVKADNVTTRNVAAIRTGAVHPDELVIYSAHYDHLGIGDPDSTGDRIFNGAVDNATGVAHILEQARLFASVPPTERSLLFLALGAEEEGLLGSEYYASHPLYPLGKTVAVLNTDSMGIAGPARDFSIAGLTRLELLDMLVAEGARQGRAFTPDRHPESGGFFRSDHFSFAKRGVPAVSFKSGADLVIGGVERGEAIARDYSTNRYHQPADEWSDAWDLSGIVADGRLLFALGLDLANSRAWPNWSQDSEFRAARDATKGDRQ